MAGEARPVRRKGSWGKRVGIAIAAVLLLGAALFTFLVLTLSYKIPSGSMIPTLLMGDRVLVMRSRGEPRRGDLVMIPSPEHPEQVFLKRVIGLPGDKLEFIDGRPIINGWLAPHCRVGSYPVQGRAYELYIEYLGESVHGTLLEGPVDAGTCKENEDCESGRACRAGHCGQLEGPWVVPQGELWVVGDDRPNSFDSRQWRGGLGQGARIDSVMGGPRVIYQRAQLSGDAQHEWVWERADGPPLLPHELSGSLGPALEKCLKERPAAAEPPKGP
jgi:signal peptidase I